MHLSLSIPSPICFDRLSWPSSRSSSSSSYICHGVGPLVDPFLSHVSRSLFKGLPWFLLPVGEKCFIVIHKAHKICYCILFVLSVSSYRNLEWGGVRAVLDNLGLLLVSQKLTKMNSLRPPALWYSKQRDMCLPVWDEIEECTALPWRHGRVPPSCTISGRKVRLTYATDHFVRGGMKPECKRFG